jgi:hypothetical protein
MLVIISADSPPPDESSRKAIQTSYWAMNRSVRAVVCVVAARSRM